MPLGKPLISVAFFKRLERHASHQRLLLIERGMTPKQVQMRMGHSSIQITYDLYGHLFDQRDADRRIGAALERDLLR